MPGDVPEVRPTKGWHTGVIAGVDVLPRHWELVLVCDVARLESGHTPSRRVPSYWEQADIQWLSLHDTKQMEATPVIFETAQQITKDGLANSSARLLPAGTVALSRTATIGKCVILGREMTTSQDFACYVPGPRLHNQFLLHLFRHMQTTWAALSGGSTHKTVYMPIFERLQVPLPPLPEQRKIATILASVDEAIHATLAVIDQTRRVKEGLLQDLLTRGIGHTRFKQTEIGEIPEAWEVRRLGDVVEPLFDDCALEPEVAYFPAIVRRRHRGVDFPESRLGAEILVKDQYRVQPGTVLVSKRQLVHGATGLVGPTVPATAIMSKEYYQLRGVKGLLTQFLSYWTRTPAFQHIAERCTYGVDREKFVVNERWFFSSPTPVPPLGEQAAIVATLDGLDAVVGGNNDRLSALQSMKSGLLQDILTGRVRVSP